jgi:dTDP-glucose pyrophosphorylase/CBS domain-containing protein
MADRRTDTAPDDLPLVAPDSSIRDAVAVIDRFGKGIALVADRERRLLATLTDGDVRRAMLRGVALEASLGELLDQRGRDHARPATAPSGTTVGDLVTLMQAAHVRQIPLLDADGRIAGLAVLDDIVDLREPPLRAVVMAGGFGRRLAPLTSETPKPMLQVGDRPLLQHIIEQLRDAGIQHVNVATHYLAEVISDHFGDGRDFGVEIDYVSEDEPLGTAGALGLLDVDGPILVVNADLLTNVDFRAMQRFHEEHVAAMTVAVRPYDLTVPFGVVRMESEAVTGIDEKPQLRGFANAGIYLVEPHICRLVQRGERLDMPELIGRLIEGGQRVAGFPLREYWLDIGRPSDYEQALGDVEAVKDIRSA